MSSHVKNERKLGLSSDCIENTKDYPELNKYKFRPLDYAVLLSSVPVQ
jgi:hypothetical protein